MTQHTPHPGAAILPALHSATRALQAARCETARAEQLAQMVSAAGGTWVAPTRPTEGLIEVSLHSVTGHGETVIEATEAWLKHARRALDADTSPLWYARQTLADMPLHDDATLIRACDILRDHSHDAHERAAAADLAHLIAGESQ